MAVLLANRVMQGNGRETATGNEGAGPGVTPSPASKGFSRVESIQCVRIQRLPCASIKSTPSGRNDKPASVTEMEFSEEVQAKVFLA
jgi:hypothetical protein